MKQLLEKHLGANGNVAVNREIDFHPDVAPKGAPNFSADTSLENSAGGSSGFAPDFSPEITDDLRRNYVKRRLGDLTDVEAALKVQDFDQLKRVGHKIRGNAASFSYLDLEQLAIALEESADQKDSMRALEVGRDFRKWILHEMCRPWFLQRTVEI